VAKNSMNSGLPYDRPIIRRPGVRYAESEFFAQDCGTIERRGFVRDMLSADSAVGRQNGQRQTWGSQQPADPLPYKG
jgi:hypothetical protein